MHLLALNVDCSYSRPTQKQLKAMPDPLDNIQLKKPPPPMVSTFNWVVIQLANLIDNVSAPVMTVSPKGSLREKPCPDRSWLCHSYSKVIPR